VGFAKGEPTRNVEGGTAMSNLREKEACDGEVRGTGGADYIPPEQKNNAAKTAGLTVSQQWCLKGPFGVW